MRVIELADTVGAEHRALDALMRRLSTPQLRQKFSPEWTVKDQLGHIAAYDGAMRKALAAGVGRGREEPEYFDDHLKWNDEQYALRKTRTPEAITAEVRENGARLLSLIKSLHEEDLIKPIRIPWGGQGTVHEMVLDGLGHARKHREELERWLEQAGSGSQ